MSINKFRCTLVYTLQLYSPYRLLYLGDFYEKSWPKETSRLPIQYLFETKPTQAIPNYKSLKTQTMQFNKKNRRIGRATEMSAAVKTV